MNAPKSMPIISDARLTPDQARAAVAYGFRNGLLTVNRPIRDELVSPDLRRELAAKEAEFTKVLNGP